MAVDTLFAYVRSLVQGASTNDVATFPHYRSTVSDVGSGADHRIFGSASRLQISNAGSGGSWTPTEVDSTGVIGEVTYEVVVGIDSWVAGRTILSTPIFEATTTGVAGEIKLAWSKTMLPAASAGSTLLVSASGKIAFKIVSAYVHPERVFTVTAIPESGVPASITKSSYNTYQFDPLPLLVGSFAPTPTVLPANKGSITLSTARVGYLVAPVPNVALISANLRGATASGTATVTATKSGVVLSYSYSISSSLAASALSSILAYGLFQRMASAYAGVSSGGASLTTYLSSSTDSNWQYSASSTITYADGITVSGEVAVAVTSVGLYGVAPGSTQIVSGFLNLPDAASTGANLTIGLDGALAAADVYPDLSSGMNSIAAQAGGLGYTLTWSLVSATSAAITITRSAVGEFRYGSSLISNPGAAPSAVSRLYGSRITAPAYITAGTSRGGIGFPALPWPTSNIAVTPGQTGVLPANVLLAVDANSGNANDRSTYALVPTVTGSSVTFPTPGSRTNDGYIGNSNGNAGVDARIKYACTAPWLSVWSAATEMTLEFDVYNNQLDADDTTIMQLMNGFTNQYGTSGGWTLGSSALTLSVELTSPTLSFDTWYHIALVADATTREARMYLDGALCFTAAGITAGQFMFEASAIDALSLFQVHDSGSGGGLNGRIDNVRLTAAAKYTANFTPPGAITGGGGAGAAAYYYPFEQGDVNPIANSGSITSHSMAIVAANLPPAVVPAPGGGYAMGINDTNATISAAVTSIAFAPLTGDFTLECWVYRDSPAGQYMTLFSMQGVYVGVYGDSGQVFAYSQNIGIAALSSTSVLPIQAWAHLAVVRTGNTLKGYLNGTPLESEFTQFGSGAVGGDLVGPTIGADGVFSNSSMPGYYDDFIVTGSAKYTASFTPAPRGSASTTTPTTDVSAGSDVFLDDFAGTATLVQQANFPDSYATSSTTLDDFTVEQIAVVDGAQFSITANTTIADFTSVAAITVGTPVNWTADSTLADFTGTSDAVASTPIDTTADSTLQDVVADGLILFLAPSEMTADQVLEEITSDGDIEVQEPNRLSAEVLMPAFRVAGSIVDGVLTGANITLPAFTVAGQFGMGAAISLPMFKMAGSATVSNVLRAAITLPTFQVQATASVAGQATANITLPAFQVAGYFGMGAAIELPAFTAAGSITAGSVLNAAIELPAFVVAGSISQPNTLRAEITLPAFTSGGFTVARITLPVFQVMGSVSPVLTAIYETYVVQMAPKVAANQTNDQVTRYTNYPFTQVVRYGNRYYGVATDGLYLLEGDTDNGTAIDWAFETCTTDFGSPEKKNVEATFLGGKAGPVVNYTIKSGGSVDQLHASTITATDVHINHRQKYGRGRRERYYALGMAGQGDISIDSIEFEVAATSRRI